MNEKEYFYLKNGTALKSLEEFYDVLNQIEDEDFNSHVSQDKNDFAEWVRHVFKDDHLADVLAKENTKEGMNKVLEKYFGIKKSLIEPKYEKKGLLAKIWSKIRGNKKING